MNYLVKASIITPVFGTYRFKGFIEDFDVQANVPAFDAVGVKFDNLFKICDVAVAAGLPEIGDAPEHKDPFDKLILAQAKTENYLLLTHDKKMTYYEDSCVILVSSSF